MSWRTRCVALAVKAAIGFAREIGAQAAQLPVLGSELVAPFRDAMGFIDGEERNRYAREPSDGLGFRQALGRKVEQTIRALRRPRNDARLLRPGDRAVQYGRWNTHVGE